jgi:uncharacterized protein HemX|tara:strand:+ start:680 stop:1756 length:1077 start_codon:yes stop_codon:yes gene_type:complete
MSKEKPTKKHTFSLGVDKPKRKILSITRWFLLTITLIFACGGLVWYGQQVVNSINASFDQNNQKLKVISESLSINRNELANITADQENMGEIFKAQNFNLEQLRNSDREQQITLNRMENQINSASVIPSGVGDHWQKHQVEYFLNVAKTELALFGNQASAQSALIASQQSIFQLPDKYQIIDQSIQLALLKLDPENYKIRRDETLSSLENINNSVDSIVFNTTDLQKLSKENNEQKSIQSVLENTWQRMVAASKSLVIVRSNSDAQSLKLNASQNKITKTLIHLQLEMARFAILKNNDEEYQASLKNCIELLEKTLASENSSVRRLIDQLNGLKKFKMRQSVEEIDDALTLLNKINTS